MITDKFKGNVGVHQRSTLNLFLFPTLLDEALRRKTSNADLVLELLQKPKSNVNVVTKGL